MDDIALRIHALKICQRFQNRSPQQSSLLYQSTNRAKAALSSILSHSHHTFLVNVFGCHGKTECAIIRGCKSRLKQSMEWLIKEPYLNTKVYRFA